MSIRCDDCDGLGRWTEAPYGLVTCATCEGSGAMQPPIDFPRTRAVLGLISALSVVAFFSFLAWMCNGLGCL